VARDLALADFCSARVTSRWSRNLRFPVVLQLWWCLADLLIGSPRRVPVVAAPTISQYIGDSAY
jgi:hypothetical protein